MPLAHSFNESMRTALALLAVQSLVSCSSGSEQSSGNAGANTEVLAGGKSSSASFTASGGAVVKGGAGSASLTATVTGGVTSTGGSRASSLGGMPYGGASSIVATTFQGGGSSATSVSSKVENGGSSASSRGSSSARGGGSNEANSSGGGASQGGASTGTSATTAIVRTCGMDGAKCRIMPLGDSITAGTCYPQLISKGLLAAGRTNFEFVGKAENNQSCGAAKVMTEGHGGYGVTYLPENSDRVPFPCTKQPQGCGSFTELQSWAAQKPDMVLMHYGTNDVWDGQSPSQILSAHLAVIHEFRARNPNVIYFVSRIIKLSPSGCSNCLTNVGKLAAALTDSWARNNSTSTSPILIVDNHASGFDPTSSTDTTDGVHPTQTGAQKSADVTVQALLDANYF